MAWQFVADLPGEFPEEAGYCHSWQHNEIYKLKLSDGSGTTKVSISNYFWNTGSVNTPDKEDRVTSNESLCTNKDTPSSS